jgi:RNA polymerase sigma factor (sigma-70 family)
MSAATSTESPEMENGSGLTVRARSRYGLERLPIHTLERESMAFFQNEPSRLAAFRAGDRNVLTQVYRHYVRAVDAYLRAVATSTRQVDLCQPGARADLLQDIFVRAFSPTARQSYDATRPFSAYLKAIARNCFLNSLRVRRHEDLDSLEEVLENAQVSEGLASDGLSCYDPKISRVVLNYLAQLPLSLRTIYEARFVLDRSQQDAAKALGLTRRQLRTSENRIQTGLRVALAKAGLSREELLSSTIHVDLGSM